jgi:2-keto-4-pentenoate hydratase/2-oxohepta-3-ene-1,7-dioic acid hydratase in catechol pathway
MRICSLELDGRRFLGARRGDDVIDLNAEDPTLPSELGALLRSPAWQPARLEELARRAAPSSYVAASAVRYRPLLADAAKILCLGLNYADHASEAALRRPEHPVVFTRYASSFVGHEQPLVCPAVSSRFDYEAEVVVVLGRRGHRIARGDALAHVAGYTLMNDGSIRDFQARTQQWTLGKNFDASGALGPELVTADELPAGARGLELRGLRNGEVMQRASTSDMLFDVEAAIAAISEVMALEPGDLIAMGTPAGVGFARTPPVYLAPGDVFEVEVPGLGLLRNRVIAEPVR